MILSRVYFIIPSILALAFSCPAQAASLESMSIEDLMNVEVYSVTKRKEQAFSTPSALYVITQEDIRRSGATSIPEALRLVPGLFVARTDANNYVITFNDQPYTQKLLVLVDGKPAHSHTFSQTFWPSVNVFIEDVERIEVILGSAAAVWGDNAVSGVISVVTKAASASPGLLATASGGDLGKYSAKARYGFGGDGYAGRAYFSAGAEDAGRKVANYKDPQDAGKMFNKSSLAQAGFRVDWESSGTRTSMQADAFSKAAGSEGAIFNGYQSETAHFIHDDKYSGSTMLLRRESDHGSATAILQMILNRATMERKFFKETMDSASAEGQIDYRGFNGHLISLGFNAREMISDITPTEALYLPDIRNDHFGLFAEDRISAGERLSFWLGAKLEKNSFTSWRFQPQVKAIWTGDLLAAWVSASRGVRLRDTVGTNLSWNWHANNLKGRMPGIDSDIWLITRIMGSKDFEPEEVTSYETGLRVRPSDSLGLDLSGFFSIFPNVEDLAAFGDPYLEMEPAPHYVQQARLQNPCEGNSAGGRLYFTADIAYWARIKGGVSVGRVWIKPKPGFEASADSARDMSNSIPLYQASMAARLDLPGGIKVDPTLYIVDASPGISIQKYTRLDLRLSYQPAPGWDISLTGRNLLTQRHVEYEFAFLEENSFVIRDFYVKATYGFN